MITAEGIGVLVKSSLTMILQGGEAVVNLALS